MKKLRKTILSIMPLALLMGICTVQNAQAGLRVKATLQTPNARIYVGNTSYGHNRSYTREVLPIRKFKHFKLSKQDRMIARRLAQYTGVPARKLIQLKSCGYRWAQIGRWLYLPRPVVRAAMNQKSWKRFLHRDQRYARRDNDAYPRHRVSHIDPAYYENFGDYDGDYNDD